MAENVITIMNKTLGSAGASSPTEGLLGAANGEGKKVSKAQQDTAKGVKELKKDGMWKKVGKTLGVSFGIATLLKQSQVFTSTFGIIFQMIGAIADVILAPALPYVMKAIIPLFKIGMSLGKSIGIIIKLGIDGIVGIIKFIDWWWTKLYPFWPKIKELFTKFGDGRFITDFVEKIADWTRNAMGDFVIPKIKEMLTIMLDWAISKLPKFMGGKGKDTPPPGIGQDVAKNIVRWVVPAVLPKAGSAAGVKVFQESLGITQADLDSIKNSPSEVESRRKIDKYGFDTGIPDTILDGIKMDADMIAAMKMNSTGYGSGYNTM